MTIQEKYGQCTAEGCNRTLSELNELNDNITIGQLKTFLTKRKAKAEEDIKNGKMGLIKKMEGKCFKIVFADDHVCFLKIDRIEPYEKYGFLDGKMFGKKATLYKGEIRVEKMNGEEEYEQFFPNKTIEEVTQTYFEGISNLYAKLSTYFIQY